MTTNAHKSDIELLSDIIGYDHAVKLLSNIPFSEITQYDKQQLIVFGLTERKVEILFSVMAFNKRLESDRSIDKICGSSDVKKLMAETFYNLHHEEFWCIFLRRNNTIIKKEMISKGGTTGTVVDPAIVSRMALYCNAKAVVFCHNHPSGNTDPSQADKDITIKLKLALDLFDITVLDHCIFAWHSMLSFADDCLL